MIVSQYSHVSNEIVFLDQERLEGQQRAIDLEQSLSARDVKEPVGELIEADHDLVWREGFVFQHEQHVIDKVIEHIVRAGPQVQALHVRKHRHREDLSPILVAYELLLQVWG